MRLGAVQMLYRFQWIFMGAQHHSDFCKVVFSKSDVLLTMHRNSVWIRNQIDVTFVVSFISPLQFAEHVSGNHVPIFRS